MSRSSDASDKYRYAKWALLIGATGLLVCSWIYYTKNKEKENKQTNPINEPIDNTQENELKSEEQQQFPVQVFVRIRPLVGLEIKQNHKSLKYNVKKLKKRQTQTLTLKNVYGRNMERDKKYKGCKNIILPSQNNIETFDRCILPCIENIFNGDKTCVFAYGHTGSGKTHTIFGYDDEPGMYRLFAGRIFSDDRIKDLNDIFIQIRFTELYQQKIRDLLSEEKEQCFLRESSNNEFILRTNPKTGKDGRLRTYPVTGINVQNENGLMDVIKKAVQSRNVGHSTLHDKSSRSHAFLEYEIVSSELLKERNLLLDKIAEIDKNRIIYAALISRNKNDLGLPSALTEEDRKLIANMDLMDTHRLNDEKKVMEKEASVIQKRIDKLLNDENRKYIGGTMVFVDLAGNEYGRDVKTKDVQEERERNEINKSLLALKECIRGLHNNKTHIQYRASNLTKYLRKYLSGNDAKAIMISNIGSSQEYAKQTINTLQYSELVAKA